MHARPDPDLPFQRVNSCVAAINNRDHKCISADRLHVADAETCHSHSNVEKTWARADRVEELLTCFQFDIRFEDRRAHRRQAVG